MSRSLPSRFKNRSSEGLLSTSVSQSRRILVSSQWSFSLPICQHFQKRCWLTRVLFFSRLALCLTFWDVQKKFWTWTGAVHDVTWIAQWLTPISSITCRLLSLKFKWITRTHSDTNLQSPWHYLSARRSTCTPLHSLILPLHHAERPDADWRKTQQSSKSRLNPEAMEVISYELLSNTIRDVSSIPCITDLRLSVICISEVHSVIKGNTIHENEYWSVSCPRWTVTLFCHP